jgi:hypothetical protein
MGDPDPVSYKKSSPPTTVSPPPAPPAGEIPARETYTEVLGVLQNIRVEAQNLLFLFGELEKDILAYESPSRTLAALGTPYQQVYDNNKSTINDHIDMLVGIIEKNPDFNQAMGDDIRIIENKWELFNKFYPDFSQGTHDMILVNMKKCSGFLSDIIYQCSFKTIPERLMQHLVTVANGQALDYYKNFEDEVCTRDQAKKILEYVADHPLSLRYPFRSEGGTRVFSYQIGVVDSARGLVFRIGSRTDQLKSLFMVVVWCVIALFASYVVLIAYRGSVTSTTLPPALSFAETTVLFVVMLGGAAAHVAIDMLKESRAAGPGELTAINDLVLWIHIREGLLKSGILVLLLGFLILVVTVPAIDTTTIFVAGYSIDSLGDVFISRFESVMETKGQVLKSPA